MTVILDKTKNSSNFALVAWFILLSIMLAIGIVAAIQVLINGLFITNLSDKVPWGLWITHDLSSIALGAGAFTFSAAVYLFKIDSLKPLARPAVFVGFLGYTSAMLALAMDIGRPDRFYYPLIYWNVHSVLWEITWCVVLYSMVLFFEVLPVVLESKYFDRWPWLRNVFAHRLHDMTPIFAVLGMALSLLHQSSLGATYGVLSGRSIWYKPSLPVMFIVSAVAGGMALTLFATILTSKLRNRSLIPDSTKFQVARVIGYIALGYLYIKLWDWAATSYYSQSPGTADALSRLRATTPYTTTFWWLEIVLGLIVPAVILLYRGFRRNDRLVLVALGLIIIGVVVNRWNVTLSGLIAPPDWSLGTLGNILVAQYTPSTPEIIVSIGILGYGLLAFTLGARYLPIFSRKWAQQEESEPEKQSPEVQVSPGD